MRVLRFGQGLWAGQAAGAAAGGESAPGAACQVTALHVHARLGLALLQHGGEAAHWDAVRSVPIWRLSASDSAAARQLLSAAVVRLEGPARGPAVGPMHTGLHFWAGQGARCGFLIYLTMNHTYVGY